VSEVAYDRLHQRTNRRSEVDQMLAVLRASGPIRSVVGFGADTGPYLELLGAAGLNATAATGFGAPPDGEFDAAVAMCSTLGRLVANHRLLAALADLSRCLRPGGLILFDVIDGQSVLTADLPVRGLTVFGEPEPRLMVGYVNDVNTDEQVYEMKLRMWRLDGDQVVDRGESTGRIRYFLPRELRFLLSVGGFELVGTASLAGQGDPDKAWLRLAWARKT